MNQPPPDLVAAMREWADSLNAEHYLGTVHLLRKGADEIERLREYEWKYKELCK